MQAFTNPFPLGTTSLIHCITNEISCEMLANGILALGCKPVMACLLYTSDAADE